MRENDETTQFDDVIVKAITEKAVLCDFSESGATKFSGECWIPLSQISEDSVINGESESGDQGTLECSLWIAGEKSLL